MGEAVQGGTLTAQALKAEGVDCVLTLSGGHIMAIYEGCRHEGIRVIDVRREQAAAHAAEAWGRVKRACGVALATSGPGVTGTVTAVANCLSAPWRSTAQERSVSAGSVACGASTTAPRSGDPRLSPYPSARLRRFRQMKSWTPNGKDRHVDA